MLNTPGAFYGQCLRNWPSAFEPERQSGGRNADASSPGFEHHRFAIKGNKPGAGPVAGLLLCCGPLAVFWRVVAVIVFPVYRAICWLFAHVCQKIGKAIFSAPSVAHLDAAPAITVKKSIGRVSASVVHRSPYPVGWAFCHAVLACGFGAAARDFFKAFEQSGRNGGNGPAVADAFPHAPCLATGAATPEKLLRYKHVKSLTCQILAAIKRFFCSLAPAGRGPTAFQVVGRACDLVAAFAKAEPHWLAGCVFSCWGFGCEAAKKLACKVVWRCHADCVKTENDTYCNHSIAVSQPRSIRSEFNAATV